MKKFASLFSVLLTVSAFIIVAINGAGCANIMSPSGGPRDTIPPILVAESPKDSATNVTTNRFTFVFNEYVEIQEAQANVLVSPTPANTPNIEYKLRTVNVRLRDTLEPNTTYSIDFGNAIKDINEGNVFKNFSYVFSTGSTIDVFTLSGKVLVAESGEVDSTLIVALHRNLDDSAVVKERPRYVAKLDGKGTFTFRNLPAGTFALYALPNNYGYRFDETQLFAFADKPIVIGEENAPVTMYAYIDSPKVAPVAAATPAPAKGSAAAQKERLRLTTNLSGDLNILTPLVLTFNRKIMNFDSTKLRLTTGENFSPVRNYKVTADTAGTAFSINHTWPAATLFNLIIEQDAFVDSGGNTLPASDTLTFTTKGEDEYGSLKLTFNNLDTSKHPVLLLLQNDRILKSVPLSGRIWSEKLFEPGEYEIRILNDANRNGYWDRGKFFGERRQPEVVDFINTKISVRANWDNEQEITL